MKILFCKVSSMKYYKGVCDEDKPINGGKFVDENGYGVEEFNFQPREYVEDDNSVTEYCLGFVETKSTNKEKSNELHFEKIDGCGHLKNEESVDDVLVVWCATSDLKDSRVRNETTVVGWYKNATVFRNYESFTVTYEDGSSEERLYNVEATVENVVLLPAGARHKFVWAAPQSKLRNYGFGQSLVWYAAEENAQDYVQKLVANIETYSAENWLYEYPKQ